MKFILFLIFSLEVIVAQNSSVYTRTFDLGDGIILSECLQTSDSGFVFCGNTLSSNGDNDCLVLKLDKMGNLKWQTSFGASDNELLTSMTESNDKSLLFTGFSKSYGEGESDILIIKLDTLGNILSSKTFGGINNDYGRSIKSTKAHGYVIGGYTNSYGTGGYDLYIIKLDSLLQIQWNKVVGGLADEIGYFVQETHKGEYIVGGGTNSFGAGGTDLYISKLDSIGTLVWTKCIGGIMNDCGRSMVQTSDKDYMICGYTNSFGAGASDIYIVKLDSNENVIGSKTIGTAGSEDGISIKKSFKNRQYLISGITNDFGAGDYDVYIAQIDSIGDLVWSQTLGNVGYESPTSFYQSLDSGYVIASNTNSYGINFKGLIIKLDKSRNSCISSGLGGSSSNINSIINFGGIDKSGGVLNNCTFSLKNQGIITDICTTTSQEPINYKPSFKIFPNPSSTYFTINSINILVKIELFSLDGFSVFKDNLSSKEYHLDISIFDKGVYFVKITDWYGEQWVEKVIIR